MGKKKSREKPFSLAPVVALLHEHLSEAVCQEVFEGVRDAERQRAWTLHALARFWLAVVIEAPPALSHLLGRTRLERQGLLPHVMASDSAFYQRCQTLSSGFFAGLYAHFVASIEKDASPVYAPQVRHLLERFESVRVIDGSRLDTIAHRLKILWKREEAILPGCVTALYDLFRGYAEQLWFDPDAAGSEFLRAQEVVETLPPGALVLGDRLYCSIELFEQLDAVGAFGLFRLKKNLKVVEVERLSRRRKDGALIEDWLVDVGSGTKPKRLRRITLRRGKTRYGALTNVLDPQRLSAEEVTALYPCRWQVEIDQPHCAHTGEGLKSRARGADNLVTRASRACPDGPEAPGPAGIDRRGGRRTMFTRCGGLPPQPERGRSAWSHGRSGTTCRYQGAVGC